MMSACLIPLVKGVRDSFYNMKRANEIPRWLSKSNIPKSDDGLTLQNRFSESLSREKCYPYSGIVFEDIIRSPQPFGYRFSAFYFIIQIEIMSNKIMQ